MNVAPRVEVVEGCRFLEHKMDVISNNLANVNTCAFKREDVAFGEVLREVSGQVTKERSISVRTDLTPGDAKPTGNPLDVALNGPGFFKVETPKGTFYTRNGTFSLNNESVLVTSEGYPVMGQGGAMTLAGSSIVINEVGGISMDQAEDGRMAEVGRLNIVTFDDPSALEKVGNSLYKLKNPTAQEVPADGTQVRQGYLEHSNVNVVEEMVQMIQVQRNYESYLKVMQSLDEIDSRLFNEAGRLA